MKPIAIAQVANFDRILNLFILAAMGALIMTWVHFSPFASIAMAR